MKRIPFVLAALLAGVAIVLSSEPQAGTARWSGPPGSAPASCANSGGSNMECKGFSCADGSFQCTSSFTLGTTPHGGLVALCICTDTAPGC